MAYTDRFTSATGLRTTLGLAAAGTSLIAVCYGLARFAYGLFVPTFRAEFGLDAATAAGGGFGPHVLRHTFATEMLRGGADHVLVAGLLGHATLDTLRVYTVPTDADRTRALDLLITDG